MTVFIVTSGSYSDYRIDAVYSTRKAAKAVAAAYSDARVEEYDVDVCYPQAQKGIKCFDVELDRRGEILSVDTHSLPYDQKEPETTYQICEAYDSYCYSRPQRLHCVCHAKDEDHAVKIASEYLTMTLARGDWKDEDDLEDTMGDI